MFKNLPIRTKLLILWGALLVSILAPIYSLIAEKKIAIDFARKELVGTEYLTTVRAIYAAVLAPPPGGSPSPAPSHGELLAALAEADGRAAHRLQTAALARDWADLLSKFWASSEDVVKRGTLLVDVLFKGQELITRISDDSNLTLDPDLDTYYLHSITMIKLPAFITRLAELQSYFEAGVRAHDTAGTMEARLSMLVGLLRSTSDEIDRNLEAAHRGNLDASLMRNLGATFAALGSSLRSYIGAVNVSVAGIDARDMSTFNEFHRRTAENALAAWAAAQTELDRLLQARISSMVQKLLAGLALIGAFSVLSFIAALLTHRHIVPPLKQLEAVASEVRSTKDYSLRAAYRSKDEIGHVTTAFNDMLAELSAARERETAQALEFARATQLTTMGAMAASIAHEINQPLGAIVTNSSTGLRWLANAPPDLGKVKEVLNRIKRDGNLASEIIASVRAMVKRDARPMTLLSVNELIEEVIGHLQDRLSAEQITLELELASEVPKVLADRVQLGQVILNLATNAADAMRRQDAPKLLRICSETREDSALMVAIADTGDGIDPSHTDRIFDPFFTTKSSGMGLGLAICRSIIEAHGGQLWASPTAPRGTVFRFTLPADAA